MTDHIQNHVGVKSIQYTDAKTDVKEEINATTSKVWNINVLHKILNHASDEMIRSVFLQFRIAGKSCHKETRSTSEKTAHGSRPVAFR